MRSRFRAALAAPVVAAAAAAVAVSLHADTTVASNAAQKIPTPESAFGFTPCQDYKLADYTQISNYFHQLNIVVWRASLSKNRIYSGIQFADPVSAHTADDRVHWLCRKQLSAPAIVDWS